MSDGYLRKTRSSIERMRSSEFGNPRYRLFFTDGTNYPTEPDADCGYGAENREFSGEIEISLNKRGHITHIRTVK